MSSIDETRIDDTIVEEIKNGSMNFLMKKMDTFLTKKAIWVWWLFYCVLTSILFGLFSLALYLLSIQWWAGVLILLITGIIWGSVRYSQRKKL